MPRTLYPFALLALATSVSSALVSGQIQPGNAVSKSTPHHSGGIANVAGFPLGALGGHAQVAAGAKHLTIKKLFAKGPGASGGLQAKDQIIAAGGKPFLAHNQNINVGGQGPMAALGQALEQAEAGKGLLKLTVLRADKTLQLQIKVPHRGSFGDSYPTNCDRSKQFYDGICQDLLNSRRKKDGAWQSRTGEDATRYVTAMCGLALLGRGKPQDAEALQKIASYLAGPKRLGYVSKDLKTPAGLSNWFICMSGIFLSEYVLATGEQQWIPTIQHLCDCLASRQTPGGRYGHGITVGYGGKGLNIINTHAHLLWALAQRAGCKIDADAWQKSLAEIVKSTGKNGGVRYWTLQTGYSDSCARTGQMALALALSNKAPKLAASMATYLDKHHLRMREAHAMGSIGMIFGTCALRRLNPAGWRRHMDSWRWYLCLMQQPNNSAEYIGGKRNNGGDHYLRTEHVANAIAGMMLASGFGNLHMSGNERKAWLRN